MTAPLLEVTDLTVRYGENVALDGVSLAVQPGEVVALLGANGAGKTTLAMAVSGIIRPAGGTIRFAGRDVASLRPDQLARLGLAHVPEGRGVLRDLSVEENLILGGACGGLSGRSLRDGIARVLERFPQLKSRLTQTGGTLSGGEQQMLVIGRALLYQPKLLVLDEPSIGLAPMLVRQSFQIVRECAELGIAILLIEQNLAMSLKVAHRAYVLSTGRVRLQGSAASLRTDPAVQDAYLGGDVAAHAGET
jgi:branched-chain amino acid transport system ATP-binding protein